MYLTRDDAGAAQAFVDVIFFAATQDTGNATKKPTAAAMIRALADVAPMVRTAMTADPARVEPMKMCKIRKRGSMGTSFVRSPSRTDLAH